MSDNYMTRLFEFLGELRENNHRDWFNANKQRYTLLREPWLADLQRLIDLLTHSRPELRGPRLCLSHLSRHSIQSR